MNVSCARKEARQRAGFTLVELLVVVAIIGVLIAILLPAVQRARESSRRAACSGNGRQIGLAIHNFLSAHGRFPRVGWNTGGGGEAPDETITRIVTLKGSWILAILPFLEEAERYDLWMGGATEANSLGKGAIKAIACPSSSWAASALGMSGKPVSNWGAVLGDTRIPYSGIGTGILSGRKGDVPITRDSVKDGLSSTAMLGEIATHDPATKKFLSVSSNPTPATRKACEDLTGTADGQGHGLQPYNSSFVSVCMAWIPNTKMCTSFKGGLHHDNVGTAAASWHPGGVHVVMGDGTVKFVKDDVDCGSVGGDPWAVNFGDSTNKGVWGAIATRAGGESMKLD